MIVDTDVAKTVEVVSSTGTDTAGVLTGLVSTGVIDEEAE